MGHTKHVFAHNFFLAHFCFITYNVIGDNGSGKCGAETIFTMSPQVRNARKHGKQKNTDISL